MKCRPAERSRRSPGILPRENVARFVLYALVAGAIAVTIRPALAQADPETASHSVAITEGAVPRAQRVLRVRQDALVRIEWSSDRVMTVHLEGYDVSVTVRPDTPALMQFRAFAGGRFAVHAHEGERGGAPATHAHGRGVLLRLEVHPK